MRILYKQNNLKQGGYMPARSDNDRQKRRRVEFSFNFSDANEVY